MGKAQRITAIEVDQVPVKLDGKIVGYAEVCLAEEADDDFRPKTTGLTLEATIFDSSIGDLTLRLMSGLEMSIESSPIAVTDKE